MKKNKSIQIVAFFGMLLFFACSFSQPEAKTQETTPWVFVKTIDLGDIAPIGIAKQGESLWLSDADNNRVVKIDLNGKILEEYNDFERPMHISVHEDKIYIPEYITDSIKILENGKRSNYILNVQPDAIAGLAVNGNTVAIADFYNNRIILQQGGTTSVIGKQGHNDGELYYPTDVAIQNNLIYVADAYNNRVQVFDVEGNYVRMIGWAEGINVATGLKVTEDQVFVTDFEGNRVLVYDLEGKLLQILSDNFNRPTDIEVIGKQLYIVNYKGKNISVYRLN